MQNKLDMVRHYTFVLRYHPDYMNNIKFILGRISGINYVICNDGVGTNVYYKEIGAILESWCTDIEYELFKSIVDEDYPGLCIFNWDGEI